jgi:hypothetical protein
MKEIDPDVRDAITAAAEIGHYKIAREIAERHAVTGKICLYCGATDTKLHASMRISAQVHDEISYIQSAFNDECTPCLDKRVSGEFKTSVFGLLKRDVV